MKDVDKIIISMSKKKQNTELIKSERKEEKEKKPRKKTMGEIFDMKKIKK